MDSIHLRIYGATQNLEITLGGQFLSQLFPLQLGIGDWNLAPTRQQNNILNNKVPVSPLPNKCYGVMTIHPVEVFKSQHKVHSNAPLI